MVGQDLEESVTFEDIKLSNCSLCSSPMDPSTGYSGNNMPGLKPAVLFALEKLSINFFDYNKLTCRTCTIRFICALNSCRNFGRIHKDSAEDTVRKELAKKMMQVNNAIIREATGRKNRSSGANTIRETVTAQQLKLGNKRTWSFNQKGERVSTSSIIITDSVVSDPELKLSKFESAPVTGRANHLTSSGVHAGQEEGKD